jgi:hypothetical protein
MIIFPLMTTWMWFEVAMASSSAACPWSQRSRISTKPR